MAKFVNKQEQENLRELIHDCMLIMINGSLFLEQIEAMFSPEEIFDNGELEAWADKNGYTRVTDRNNNTNPSIVDPVMVSSLRSTE